MGGGGVFLMLSLRHTQEHQQGGGEEEERPLGRPRRGGGPLPPGPVAQRAVAAGDADRVEPAGAELLVARGGDEAGSGGGAGLPIMRPCWRADREGFSVTRRAAPLGGGGHPARGRNTTFTLQRGPSFPPAVITGL